MGRLKKGGVPDQVVAARIVLNDWNCGKIKYFTYPPEDNKIVGEGEEVVMQDSEIVSEFAKEFNLDDLNIIKMESDDMENLPNILPSQTMLLQSTGIVEEHRHGEQSDIDISDHEDCQNGGVGKENLLSDRISIRATADSIPIHKKVNIPW